ncbi:MAG: major capsid protein [Ruminococcus sp.]|nr:major capsid protein [Ruminococcus sp.]
MNWENNYIGKIPANDWLNIPFDVRRRSTPENILFGDEKTENLTARWQTIASQYQIPQMAYFHAFDTETHITSRIPIDTHSIEKGLIKTKINQSERLLELMRTGVSNDDLIRYVIDDGMNLAEQIITRTGAAKNEVLATGKCTIKENNLNLTIDYGVPSSNMAYEIDFAKDADVPAQLQAIIDDATDAGVVLTGIYTSKRNITNIRSHASIQKVINGSNSVGALVTNTQLNAYLNDEFGITQVITNDNIYNSGNTLGADGRPVVNMKRYFPKDKMTFFSLPSNSRIGMGLWGNPPEALNPLIKSTTSSASPYIYITQWTENDPAVLWTKASALFIPVLYYPSALYIATTKNSDNTKESQVNLEK